MHADVLCPSSRSVDGNSCSAGYWSRETANRHAGSNHPAVVERYTSLAPDYRRPTQASENATVRERALESKTRIDLIELPCLRRTQERRSASSTQSQVPAPVFWAVAPEIPNARTLCKLSLAAFARPDSPGSTRTRERNMFDERHDFAVSSHPGFSTKPNILIPTLGLCRPTLHSSTPQIWACPNIWHHLTSRRTSMGVFSTITNGQQVDEIMARW